MLWRGETEAQRGMAQCPWGRATASHHPDHLMYPSASSSRFIFPTTRLGAESQFSDFLDGLGPAQIVGRQTLATPPMGESSREPSEWGDGGHAAEGGSSGGAPPCNASCREEPSVWLLQQGEGVNRALRSPSLIREGRGSSFALPATPAAALQHVPPLPHHTPAPPPSHRQLRAWQHRVSAPCKMLNQSRHSTDVQ